MSSKNSIWPRNQDLQGYQDTSASDFDWLDPISDRGQSEAKGPTRPQPQGPAILLGIIPFWLSTTTTMQLQERPCPTSKMSKMFLKIKGALKLSKFDSSQRRQKCILNVNTLISIITDDRLSFRTSLKLRVLRK